MQKGGDNTIMKKEKPSQRHSFGDDIMNSKPAVLLVAIAGILLGIFFIVSQAANKPILRSEAVSYSGEFEDWIKNVDRIVKKYGSHSLFIHFPEMSLKQAEYLLDYADKHWSDVKGSFCESLEK